MPQDVAASDIIVDGGPPLPAEAAVTLFVCSTCRRAGEAEDAPRVGERLFRAARHAAEGAAVRVRSVRCLASCARAPAAVMSRPGAWSYLFGNLDPEADGAALVEGALLLGASAEGLLPWRGRPDCLKRNMVGRLPPADLAEEPPS